MAVLDEAARWRRNHVPSGRMTALLGALDLVLDEMSTDAEEANIYVLLGSGRSDGLIERMRYEYRHPRIRVELHLSGPPWTYLREVRLP
jgi:hypothetical protein